jgi:site-specific DNA-methyltransferase (adenine-specific)
MPIEHNLNDCQLFHGDCLEVLLKISDNSVDLIATDPPYFGVKKNDWDNQWPDVESFLAWLDDVLFQFFRVLKPTGSLYLFCSPQLSAETEMLIKQRFDVLNHIVWAKPSGMFMRHCKENLRSFAAKTERVIFAQHYNADGFAKGAVGYYQKKEQAKQNAFAPIIEYFKQARIDLKVPAKAINEATGTQMCSHWFSESQWKLPTQEQYEKLQMLFAEYANNQLNPLYRDYDDVVHEVTGLTVDYDALKEQFELARRYFKVSAQVQYTDVWDFKVVQPYPGKHVCEKPAAMMEHIISTSSRPGDVVLDAFLGSGSTAKAALKLGRKVIGIEFEEETYLKTKAEIESL